ncbi:MAG: hypothetical protein LH472_03730 [Pyrinomonadaceae bacterium]|nr:hypothetical protein [Pyrinomonadaceae bacterium]
MLKNKVGSFAFISFNSAFIFTALAIIIFILGNILAHGSVNRFPSGGGEFFGVGLFVGVTHAVIFMILSWQNKAESLSHIFLSTFVTVELFLVLSFIYLFVTFPRENFYEINFDELRVFLKYGGLGFIRCSLFVALLSIVAGMINKKLLKQIKNKNLIR